MNPWLIIGALLSVAFAGWGGFSLGVDHEKASQIDKQQLVAEAVDAGLASAAEVISKQATKHSTIRQVLEKEIHENTIYKDCKSTQAAVDAFNSGIDSVRNSDGKTADGNPAGGLKLPGKNPNP